MGYIIVSMKWDACLGDLMKVALMFESEKYEIDGVAFEDSTPVVDIYGYPSTLSVKEK